MAREQMQDCAIMFWTLIERKTFLFRYASQSPIFVAMSPMFENTGQSAADKARVRGLFADGEFFDWTWRVHIGDYVYSYDMQHNPDEKISIIPHCVAVHSHHIASHSRPMRLDAFVHGVSKRAPEPRHGDRGGHSEKLPSFEDRFP